MNNKIWMFLLLFFSISLSLSAQKEVISYENTPVIYSSDIWFPPGDPDDHFDLLTLMSLDKISVEAIIIDNTMQANIARTKTHKIPNVEAIKKVSILFGKKKIPAAFVGMEQKLKSSEDKAIYATEEEQKAAKLLLSTLRNSASKSAIIITTGSLRDVCSAYNREPNLFHQKVRKIIISIGDSYGIAGTADTNTAKDVEAWKGIMNSGLPIDWMPTNPSKGRGGPSRYCSHWYFIQSELLKKTPKNLQEFLNSEKINPEAAKQRHMWSTPAFVEISGKKCYLVGKEIKWLFPEEAENFPETELLNPYEFVPVTFELDEYGVAIWQETSGNDSNIRILRINDYYMYHEAMYNFLLEQFNNAIK